MACHEILITCLIWPSLNISVYSEQSFEGNKNKTNKRGTPLSRSLHCAINLLLFVWMNCPFIIPIQIDLEVHARCAYCEYLNYKFNQRHQDQLWAWLFKISPTFFSDFKNLLAHKLGIPLPMSRVYYWCSIFLGCQRFGGFKGHCKRVAPDLFFSNFSMLLKRQSSISIFNQVWHYSKYESRKS